MDHPYYRYDWLAEQHRNLIVSCIDRNHCNFLQKYYKNIDAVQFVPHGGNLSEKPPKPFADREIDVAFLVHAALQMNTNQLWIKCRKTL